MTEPRCGNCKHWAWVGYPEPCEDDPSPLVFGTCGRVRFITDIGDGKLRDELALIDGNGHKAAMLSQVGFGCVLFEPKGEATP